MAVFFWYVVKVTCTVYTCTVAYTGQVTFYKVPENMAIFIWSVYTIIHVYSGLKRNTGKSGLLKKYTGMNGTVGNSIHAASPKHKKGCLEGRSKEKNCGHRKKTYII